MIVQMDTDIPRFNPIPYGSGIDYPATGDGPPEFGSRSNRRKPYGSARLVARAVYGSYRSRVVILSGIAFLGTTAFTVYASTLGR